MAKKITNVVVLGSAVGTLFGGALLAKLYMGGKTYDEDTPVEGKVFVITGANTGIGKETAWGLAKRGGKVYMLCRDLRKCEKAREEIVLDTKNKYVYCRRCDLSSQKSIREFAEMFKKESSRLDVLINNAGVMRCPLGRTREGIETQLGVNHMGHFLLTNLLLDLIKESSPSRIINLSSVAHKRGQINKKDLNSEKDYDAGAAYAQSKLANIHFTQELSSRLKGSGVTVNSVHPGIVDTDITRHMSFYKSYIAALIIKPFIWPFIKSPNQGAQTVLYAALSPDIASSTGKYFVDCEEQETSENSHDVDTSRWLWAVSEKWTSVSAA